MRYVMFVVDDRIFCIMIVLFVKIKTIVLTLLFHYSHT